MAWIFSQLKNTDQSKIAYIIKGYFIAAIPCFIIAILLFGILTHFSLMPEVDESEMRITIMDAFGIIIFSPWSETLLMYVLFSFLKVCKIKGNWLVFISALLWSGGHSFLEWQWGIVVFWGFVVFSISFLEWQKKSNRDAIFVTGTIHMINNSVVALFLILTNPPN